MLDHKNIMIMCMIRTKKRKQTFPKRSQITNKQTNICIQPNLSTKIKMLDAAFLFQLKNKKKTNKQIDVKPFHRDHKARCSLPPPAQAFGNKTSACPDHKDLRGKCIC